MTFNFYNSVKFGPLEMQVMTPKLNPVIPK